LGQVHINSNEWQTFGKKIVPVTLQDDGGAMTVAMGVAASMHGLLTAGVRSERNRPSRIYNMGRTT
jgi:hypothetical protein